MNDSPNGNPKQTVAILGASADRAKFGNKSLRAHVQQGFEVYPVNPKGGEIEGLQVYTSLSDIPVELDRVSVYLPPSVAFKLMDDIVAKGCGEVWLNPGSESDEFLQRGTQLGLKVIRDCSIVAIGCSPSEFGA